MTGRIVRMYRDKGFGFIHAEGLDYFFHRSDTNGEFNNLKERDMVDFNPIQAAKGPRAEMVSIKV